MVDTYNHRICVHAPDGTGVPRSQEPPPPPRTSIGPPAKSYFWVLGGGGVLMSEVPL